MTQNKDYTHSSLYELYRSQHSNFGRHFNSRMRRALSWLERAEQEKDDPHAGFIFYWISFNAGYSPPLEENDQNETSKQYRYFHMLVQNDSTDLIQDLVWQKRQVEIKRLLKNKFIYGPFWRASDPLNDISWKPGFQAQKRKIKTAFEQQNTTKVLQILFGRLYVLRNQLMHGNATWRGERNRRQVEDGYRLISRFQGLFLLTMLKKPQANWGEVSYDLYAQGNDDY